MKIAIMQPYLFPFIGYFQLVNAVDKFIIYDDVNFIKGGWINRNRILINGKAAYVNVGMKEASPYKLICEIEIDKSFLWRGKTLKKIQSSYGKSPNFQMVFPVLEEIINFPADGISDFIANSITEICEFLEVETKIVKSSGIFRNRELRGVARVLDICRQNSADVYINSIGGQNLYAKEEFRANEIELKFLKTKPIVYRQFQNEFVPNLSIIDVLMFNSKEETREMLGFYELV